MLYDPDEIVRRVVEQSNAIKYTMDACIDVNGPSMLVLVFSLYLHIVEIGYSGTPKNSFLKKSDIKLYYAEY